MPNEIYHKSHWGNANAEGFGDVYFDAAATNKLYNHSDYYENSNGTDKTLRDLSNKASIVLTPTAYSNGSLNTVIPPYQVLSELVTNGDFSNGTTSWTLDDASNGSISVVDGKLEIVSNGGAGYPVVKQGISTSIGKKYSVTFNVENNTTGFWFRISQFESHLSGDTTFYADDKTSSINFKGEFTAISTTSYIKIFAEQNDAGSFKIDSISIKEIQEADFDFSRGSSATRVNEQGLIEDVQILSGNLVQNGDFEQIGSELVTNGDFATDSDWTLGTGWSVSDGKLVGDGAESNALQSGVVQNGKTYKITLTANNITTGYISVRIGSGGSENFQVNSNGTQTFYTTADNGTFVLFRNQSGFDGSIDNVSVKEVGQNWSLGSDTTIGNSKLIINNQTGGNVQTSQNDVVVVNNSYKVVFTISDYTSGEFRLFNTFDDFTTYNSNGTYTVYAKAYLGTTLNLFSNANSQYSIDNISVIEITDDTDIPRIDYTSGFGSLLLEPQRTNLVTYSEDFSVWSIGGIVTRTSGFLAPDGTNTAYKIEGTIGSSTMYRTSESSTTATRSIWARSVSGTGTVGLLSYYSNQNRLFTVTEEWQRFEISGTTTSTGASNFYAIDFRDATQTLSEVIIWGAQSEEGDYATSYIVSNSGSATTRSADVANNSGNADLFNDSEGVLYAEFSALADDLTRRIITITDATLNNIVKLY